MSTFKLNQIAKAVLIAMATMAIPAVSYADDAAIFRKNVSKTPLKETEYSNVKFLYFYVPAQNSAGELLTTGLPYVDPATLPTDLPADPESHEIDISTLPTRLEAKPLVAVYNDGFVAGVDGTAFAGHGQRDAMAAISLDDGATWRITNVSKSASKSSFTLDSPVTLYDGTSTTKYPGDVTGVYSATVANKILVAWQSRYCATGYPAYVKAPIDGTALTVTDAVGNVVTYQDLYGVRGGQKSVDYSTVDFKMDEFDRAVGEVPFSCLWTARGQMYTKDGKTSVQWTVPERLTSGRRDVNRIEVTANKGGFTITWQEDPDGLLPGSGEGSGEGWAGAVTNPETDIWYSYVTYANFGYIDTVTTDAETLPTPVAFDINNLPTATPRAGVLFSVPVRLTDNAKCAPVGANGDPDFVDDPYCYADLNNNGVADLCATTGTFLQGNGSADTIEVCVAEDGRPMLGQTSASRARQQSAYAVNAKDATDYRNWVAVAYEERKALGDIDENADGEEDESGKNARHQSFEMRTPTVVRQGFQLNQPSTYWNEEWADVLKEGTTSTYPTFTRAGPGGVSHTYAYRIFDPTLTFDHNLYDSDIARRTSTMVNMTPLKDLKNLTNRISMIALYKEGLDNQGGPADIFARRFQVATTYNPLNKTVDANGEQSLANPFHPRKMICTWPNGTSAWIYKPLEDYGKNIHYIEGLCGGFATNLSATIPELCEDTEGGESACLYDGSVDPFDQTQFPKTVQWDQTKDELNLNSWWNTYEVAKGHRGYLDGDFAMILYAWSPNYKQLADGKDHYNLYIRRSFDGGKTYTTTPAGTVGGVAYNGDGTTTCENYLTGDYECTTYAAGAFEKSRNVSQLMDLKDTVLDPRYTPTGSPTTGSWDPSYTLVGLDIVDDTTPYPDDVTRDRSKFFGVFESGDTRYVGTEGEPHPWDMFASRAYNWGDDYYLVPYTTNDLAFWDGLETWEEKYSGEAAVISNMSGTYMYSIWNQWEYDTVIPEADSESINNDAIFRKTLFYYPTIILDTRTGTGTNPIGPGTE